MCLRSGNAVLILVTEILYVVEQVIDILCIILLPRVTMSKLEAWSVKVLFYLMLTVIRKSIVVFDGFQSSPACPSDKSIIKMKVSMEHW
jgi:hypothetical protein